MSTYITEQLETAAATALLLDISLKWEQMFVTRSRGRSETLVDQAIICNRWQVPQLAHKAGGPKFAFWENSTRPGQLVVCACSNDTMSSQREKQYGNLCISQHSSKQMQTFRELNSMAGPAAASTLHEKEYKTEVQPQQTEGQFAHLQ